MRRFQPLHAALLLATLVLQLALVVPARAGSSDAESDAEPTAAKAAVLRDEGLAHLENENPDQAEKDYRALIELRPDDPLGHANLAIALLRQQRHDEALAAIARALELAPGRADLLAIRGEVRQWQGDLEGALLDHRDAAEAAPDDPEIVYSAYSLATTLDGETADEVARAALERLAVLRPENVVVLLQLGQDAIARGDRQTATKVFLRVDELLWQVPPLAERAMGMVQDALEGDDLSAARVPALRLENVLKVSPMFRESLRELKTGIQGIPVRDFVDAPEPEDFGPPLDDVRFAAAALPPPRDAASGETGDAGPTATALRGLVAADLTPADEDVRPDVARLRTDDVIELRPAAAGWTVERTFPAPAGATVLEAVDLDNDARLDLLACGPSGCAVHLATADGWSSPGGALGLSDAVVADVAVVDFDIEGDVDLATVPGSEAADGADSDDAAPGLWRNALDGPLESVGDRAFPDLEIDSLRAVVSSDLDRDGDLDLALGHGKGITFLRNLRQGRFEDASAQAQLAEAAPVADLVSADLDNDGRPELVAARLGLSLWQNEDPDAEAPGDVRFGWDRRPGLPATGLFRRLVAFDADNDGRLDLAASGPAGVVVLQQTAEGRFRTIEVVGAPERPASLATADLDGDGDLDLLVGEEDGPGLLWLENEGGDAYGWLRVTLRGLDKGASKNNSYGVGSLVEVRDGGAYQFREAAGDAVHFGLGRQKEAEVLRVVWTNGVPQNRIGLEGRQRIVEEQLLKGSCPFLYAWDGDGFRFVTDLLWGAPLGLPAAEGAWVPADPSEIVRVDGLVLEDGVYRLRITEELWEAAFFDHVRLWVVDHPADAEAASALRIVPGGVDTPEEVRLSRELRPVAAAWDGEGREVTQRIRARDDVYADGYRESPYQGVAPEWPFTFELGEAPASPVRLHLDGWIFPADASLNLAVDQRDDYPYLPPRLEVETAEGWQTLMPRFGPEAFGHPAGKTKTMVVDTPPLPEGASKLRLVTSLWLHWDRIAWTTAESAADEEARITAKLDPSVAELRRRGFSEMVRRAPNAPHEYDYARVRAESPWSPFPGHYTRFGDVRPLLETVDDFSAVLAPGDEIVLEFDAGHLPPPPEGHRRTLFLESHGWDKDADRNTWEGRQMEPLPFHAMGSYPYPDGVTYPDTPEHRRYVEEWQTRKVR